jgi:hypothetical protein
MALLFVSCVFGGIFVGSSSSQDARPGAPESGVGRFQIIQTHSQRTVFDTKTAERWENLYDGRGWKKYAAPWDDDK